MSLFRSLPSARQVTTAFTLLRLVVGVIFIMHGGQKLFVYGFAGVTGAFAGMGIPMPGLMGPFVALLEFFGGIALVVGLLTRIASFGLAITMLVAIVAVHLKAGFFAPAGYEFPLALLATLSALAVTGAGPLSIDALIDARRSGGRRTAATPAAPGTARRVA